MYRRAGAVLLRPHRPGHRRDDRQRHGHAGRAAARGGDASRCRVVRLVSGRASYRDLVAGWRNACELARCAWGGGETPTLSGVVEPHRRARRLGDRHRQTEGRDPGEHPAWRRDRPVRELGYSRQRTDAGAGDRRKLPEATSHPSDGRAYGEALSIRRTSTSVSSRIASIGASNRLRGQCHRSWLAQADARFRIVRVRCRSPSKPHRLHVYSGARPRGRRGSIRQLQHGRWVRRVRAGEGRRYGPRGLRRSFRSAPSAPVMSNRATRRRSLSSQGTLVLRRNPVRPLGGVRPLFARPRFAAPSNLVARPSFCHSWLP